MVIRTLLTKKEYFFETNHSSEKPEILKNDEKT